MSSRVIVIIPAYNEGETIASVIETLQQENPDYDIVVIDDGSRDNTASVVANFSQVNLIHLPFNIGIGGAMQTGYKFAYREKYDIAVQCDGDGQHPVHQIHRLVDHIERGTADLIVGSRYVQDTEYNPTLPRRVGKSLLSRVVHSIIGGGITDTTSGFRAANRTVIKLFAHTYPDDYPEAEALVIVHKNGLKAAEVSVDMLPRQGGRTSIAALWGPYYIMKVGLALFIAIFRKFTQQEGEP